MADNNKRTASDKYGDTYGKDFADKKAMRDTELSDGVTSLFSRILDQYGMNVRNPATAEALFHNPNKNSGAAFMSPAYKTHIFMTRPSCMLSNLPEIFRVPQLYQAMHTSLGRSLLGLLQFPRREYLGSLARVDRGTAKKLEPQFCHLGPFIPLVSNRCVSSDGAKDLTVDSYDGPEDYLGHRRKYPLRSEEINNSGTTSLTFDDTQSSPILLFHYYWNLYMSAVMSGVMSPDAYYIHHKLLDFATSIYIILTHGDGRTIHSYCKYTGCYPNSVPFNYLKHSNEFDGNSLKDVTISYTYNRYDLMEPWILNEINALTIPYAFVEDNGQTVSEIPDIVDIRHISQKKYPSKYANKQPILRRFMNEYSRLPDKDIQDIFKTTVNNMGKWEEGEAEKNITNTFYPMLSSVSMLNPLLHKRAVHRLPEGVLSDPLAGGVDNIYMEKYSEPLDRFQDHRDPVLAEINQNQVYGHFQRQDKENHSLFTKAKLETDFSQSSYIGGNPVIVNNRLFYI